MRLFKNAWFERFARREKITDKVLKNAISRAEQGMIDADLGGYVIKQRIARQGQGKSGGYGIIIVFKKGENNFFVYGFAKSERGNIDKAERETFKNLAKELLTLSDMQIKRLIEERGLIEIQL